MLRRIVARGNWLSLDTETTGIDEDAEVVEVALVSPIGEVLFESLVRPLGVEFFRAFYGPTNRAFAALDEEGQAALRADLEAHWAEHNRAWDGTTRLDSELLVVRAVRA